MEAKVQVIIDITSKLLSHFELKAAIGTIIGTISFFVSPDGHIPVLALFVLVCFDMITGMMVARHQPDSVITSERTVVTPIKFAIFFMAFGGARMVELATQEQIPFIDEAVIGIIAFNEFLSMMENMADLGYVFPRKVIDFISNIKKK